MNAPAQKHDGVSSEVSSYSIDLLLACVCANNLSRPCNYTCFRGPSVLAYIDVIHVSTFSLPWSAYFCPDGSAKFLQIKKYGTTINSINTIKKLNIIIVIRLQQSQDSIQQTKR